MKRKSVQMAGKIGENEKSPLVTTNESSTLKKQSSTVVFQPGSEYAQDYDTFRIPAILCHDGMCLAFCEGRRESKKDYGPIDIVLRRGTLGEKGDIDWEDRVIKVVCSTDKLRVMNPSPVVDRKTGDILLLYIELPVSATEASLVVKDKCVQKFLCIRSRDKGLRWESPTEITDVFQEMKDTPLLYAPGPGHAIQMKKSGRIIVSGNSQYKLPSKFPRIRRLVNKSIAPFYGVANKCCIVYSDDDGKTWKAGADIQSAVYCCNRRPVHANESQASELHDGRLYVNSRTKEPRQNRQSAFSSDEGESFTSEETKLEEPSGVPRFLAAFIPNSLMCGGCEGSILTFPLPKDLQDANEKEEVLIFSNPASKFKRKNMSLRISKDDGFSWSGPMTVYVGPSAYSDLVHLQVKGDGPSLLGCLYECGKKSAVEHIVLDTFNIRDVID